MSRGSGPLLQGECEAVREHAEDSNKNDQKPGNTSSKERQEAVACSFERGRHGMGLQGCKGLLQKRE